MKRSLLTRAFSLTANALGITAAGVLMLLPGAAAAQTLFRADGSWNTQASSWGTSGNWSHTAALVPGTATAAINTRAANVTPVRSGGIISVQITNGGSGYLTPPTVAFSGGGASAAATAVLVDGVVTAINITNRGTNYNVGTTVTLGVPPGGGTQATATCVVAADWKINTINITNRGSGYTSAPDVVLTGGGGTGAAAKALVAGGQVHTIYITNVGSGYETAPTVSFTGGGGTGAAATAVRSPSVPAYVITGSPGANYTLPPMINVTGGGGYTSAPAVVFTGGGGVNAVATATVAGGMITGVNIANGEGGTGYTSPPTVTFTGGGGGTGATAVATISGGSVTSIRVINPGGPSGATAVSTVNGGELSSVTAVNTGVGYNAQPTASPAGELNTVSVFETGAGYTSVPRVTFTAGGSYTAAAVTLAGGGGTGATATVVLSNGQVSGITITNGGTGYTSAPIVSITGGDGTGATATATVGGGQVQTLNITNMGSGYRTPPGVTFNGGGGTGATATTQISTPGQVFAINITNGGSGYLLPPSVIFTTNTGGIGASAVASINGSGVVTGATVVTPGGATGAFATPILSPSDGRIIGYTVNSPGTGYTGNPTVAVEAPTIGGIGSLVHFNNDIGGNRIITLDGPRTVGLMTIGDLSGGEDYILQSGTGGSLTFDMGAVGAGNSFLNKFQGDQDAIETNITLNDQLNARVNAGRLSIRGSLGGNGSLRSYGSGTLSIVGPADGSNLSLWIWNRGTTSTGAQVELGVDSNGAINNAFGGDIRLGNVSYGSAGYAVLQLDQTRNNFDQINDSAMLFVDAVSSRWGYFKLMGGDETLGSIMDISNGIVLENMESETINTDAMLTLGGDNSDSYIGAHVRNRAGGSGTGVLGITKNGTGRLLMQGGSVIYTGSTFLNEGLLHLRDTTGFNSNITAAAGTRVILERTSGTWDFNDQIFGSADVIKTGTGTLNFNSGGIRLEDLTMNGGILQVNAGVATLNGQRNAFTGEFSIVGDAGLNRSVRIAAGLSINGLTAEGRYGQTGSTFIISGARLGTSALNATPVMMEAVLESSASVNITNMMVTLNSAVVAITKTSQGNSPGNTATVTVTDASNLIIGSVLTSDETDCSIPSDTRILSVNLSTRTITLNRNVTIPPARTLVFTAANKTDGSLRNEYLDFTSVIHDGRKFVATTSEGTIHCSANGTIWDHVFSVPAGDPLYSVAWTGENLVAVGSSTSAFTSPDSLNWAIFPTGSGFSLNEVMSTVEGFTGNLAGSTTITNVPNAASFSPGMPVVGLATVPETTISFVNVGGRALTLSFPARVTATGVDFGFFTASTTADSTAVTNVSTVGKLPQGLAVQGSGIAGGATISAVDAAAGTLTLSAPVTGTGASGVRINTLTGTTTNGSLVITNVSNFNGLVKGMVLTGAGIQVGSTITDMDTTAGTITLSVEAFASATVPMGVFTGRTTTNDPVVRDVTSIGAFLVGMPAKGRTIPAGATVASAAGTTVTLSVPAYATGTATGMLVTKTQKNFTGNLQAGNLLVTNVTNIGGLAIGMPVSGPNILSSTVTITDIDSGAGTITLSADPGVDVTGASLSAGFNVLAVGSFGSIRTSVDGKKWAASDSGTTRDLSGVAWSPASSRFVAVGADGFVITSADGYTWLGQPLLFPDGTEVELNTGSAALSLNNQPNVAGLVAGVGFGHFRATVNANPDYVTPPTVTISGGGGNGATATATLLNGAVETLTLTDPGSGYSSAPTVTINGPGGATATATVVGGEVATLTVTNKGGRRTLTSVTGMPGLTVGTVTGGNPGQLAGFYISTATGIAPGTQITAVNEGSATLTLSSPATANVNNTVLRTYNGDTLNKSNVIRRVSSFKGLAVGMQLSGVGLPNAMTILAMDPVERTITLSGEATSTNAGGGLGAYRGSIANASTTVTNVQLLGSLLPGMDVAASDLESVHWTGSQFVAVGKYGVIQTSPDGLVWTVRTSTTGRDLYAVSTSGGQILAAGEDGIILRSTDGITWQTARAAASPMLNDVRHVAELRAVGAASGQTIALGNGGVATANATTWSTAISDTFSGSRNTLVITGRPGGAGGVVLLNEVLNSTTTKPTAGGQVTDQNNPNRIDDATELVSRGGIFEFVNDQTPAINFSEKIGALTLNQGQLQIAAYRAGLNGTSTLTFDSLNRQVGGTLEFLGRERINSVVTNLHNSLGENDRNRIFFTNAPVLDDGIIGGWAIAGGPAAVITEWATYGPGGVVPLDTNADYDLGDQTGWISTDNVKMRAGRSLNANRAVNSLNMQGQTLSLNTFRLSIESGGLLVHTGAATINSTTVNGYLTVGTAMNEPKDLVLITNNTLTVNAPIKDFVSDQGLVAPISSTTLTSVNTVGLVVGMEVKGAAYAPGTYITSINTSNNQVILNKPTIAAVTAANLTSFLGGPVSLTKSGTGALVLTATNSYTGKTYISNGFVRFTNPIMLGNQPGSFVQDHIQLNGGTLQLGHFIAAGATTPLPDYNVAMDDGARGITIGIAGGRLEVGQSNPDRDNAVVTSAIPVVNFTITNPINAIGVLELAVRANLNLGQRNSLTIGTSSSQNTFVRGIITEGGFSGNINILGDNTIGGLFMEEGTVSLPGNNNFTGLIRVTTGDLLVSGSNKYNNTDTFSDTISVRTGVLKLTSPTAFGTGGLLLSMGDGAELRLAGVPQTINDITSAALSSITNFDANPNLTSPTVLTFDNFRNTTFLGTIRNGGIVPIKVVKKGTGTLNLTNPGNDFRGGLEILEGAVNVTSVDYSETTSAIGRVTSTNPNLLIIDKAVLSFTPTGLQATDRSFTMGAGPDGATLVANGATQNSRVTIGLEYRDLIDPNNDIVSPAIAFRGTGSRTLTLSGIGTGDNQFALELKDLSPNELSGLYKSGTGTWVLAKSAPYSALTTVLEGVLGVSANNALGTKSTDTTVDHGANTFTGNLPNGTPVSFPRFIGTSMPAGIRPDVNYYVVGSTGGTFQVAATPGGAPIDFTSAGANVTYVPNISSLKTTQLNAGTDQFAGRLPNGTPVTFGVQTIAGVIGTTPTGLQPNLTYYVINSDGENFQVSETLNGPAMDFTTAGSGTLFYSTATIGNTSGGVNLMSGSLSLRNVDYVTPEPLLFEGGSLSLPANTESTWAGDLFINANTTLTVSAGAVLNLTGNLLGGRAIVQAGEGTLRLSGEMPLPSTLVSNNIRHFTVQAGTLMLDYSSNNNSKLSDSATLTLGGSRRGGTLLLSGGSHEEITGATTLQTGANKIFRSDGSSVVRLNLVNRVPGGSLYFDVGRIAKVDNLNNNGILGAWALIRDALSHAFLVIPGSSSISLQVVADDSANTLSTAPTPHQLVNGTQIKFSSTGTLPGGLTAGTTYFVANALPNTFRVANSFGGPPLDLTSAGTGILTVTTQLGVIPSDVADTFSTLPVQHRLATNSVVRFFTTGTLPAGLQADTDYFVSVVNPITFRVTATLNGPTVDITNTGSGVLTVVTQGALKRVGTAALTFSANPDFLPGDEGNGKIKVAISPSLGAGPITSSLTGAGTLGDPYLYTIFTTSDNNSTDAVVQFVNGDTTVANILAAAKSGNDSTADTNAYGAPAGIFLAGGTYDNGNTDITWARNASNTGDGLVMPTTNFLTNDWARNSNTNIVSSRDQNVDSTAFSLRFASQVAANVNLLGGLNTIRTGGILVSPTVGAFDSGISGAGALTTEGQGNLQNFLIHQYNTQGSLIITAPITDRAPVQRLGVLTGDRIGAADSPGVEFNDARRTLAGVTTTEGILPSMQVSGTGIPVGATVVSVNHDAHVVVLNVDHSFNATRTEVTFTGGPVPIKSMATLPNGDKRRVNGIVVPANPALGLPSTVSTHDLYVGMSIVGPGIPAGFTITFIYNESDIQVNTDHFFTAEISNLTFRPVTGIEKLGPGSVVLGGNSTYTGVTFVGDGTLRALNLTDGGVPGSLGISNAGAGNLVFNGGELQYVGENASTNRGFTLSEFASLNIGHERTIAAFSGVVSGTDRLEKDGPGTLLMNGNAGLAEIRVEQGKLLFQTVDTNFAPNGFSPSNFATTGLTSVRLAGGILELRGTQEGDTNQNFGNQLFVEQGASEVKAISVLGYDPNNLNAGRLPRITNLRLMGSEELTDVVRHAGGTVRFIEAPEEGAGAANIFLNLPGNDRNEILPWAVYRNLFDFSTGGINEFAVASDTTAGGQIVPANQLQIHDFGSFYMDPNNWGTGVNGIIQGRGINPSEDMSSPTRTFTGLLQSTAPLPINWKTFVNTLRYASSYDGEINIATGNSLVLVSGAILAAYDVRAGLKQINGPGDLTGGAPAVEGRDLLMHNYNTAAPFSIGANVVDLQIVPTGKGNARLGDTTLKFNSSNSFSQLREGMKVEGPGIAPGTTILVVDATFRRIILSEPAIADVNLGTYTFMDYVNFVQSGVGTTVLTGNNTYTGSTFVHGGVLKVASPNAVPGGLGVSGGLSGIVIEDGVLGLASGDFTRGVGTGIDQVQFMGSGGFAAYGADRIVNFGGLAAPDVLRYGNNGFVTDGSSLVLGAHDATHKITLLNPLDLSAFSQVIRTDDGPAAVEGQLGGALSGQGKLIKLGAGTLRLAVSNTHNGGVEISEGRLLAANVPDVFGPAGPGTGAVKMGTSLTNTTAGAALNLQIEGGDVTKKLEIGSVNAVGSAWVKGGTTDSGQLAADLGQHASMLVVDDLPAIAYYDATNKDLKYVRALDNRGTAWGVPVTVTSRGDVGQYCSLQIINGLPAISYYDATNGSLMFVRATDSTGVFWGTPVIADNVQVSCVGVQSDGSIIVGGTFTRIDRTTRSRLARILPNGTLDPTFNPLIENGEVRCILVEPDDRIIIAGTFTNIRANATDPTPTTRNRIARLNTNGTLDTYNPNLNGDVRVLTRLSNGQVLVGGAFTTVGATAVARGRIARLNTNGSLDTAFNADVSNGEVRAIAVQADGKYVIGGSFTTFDTTPGATVTNVTRNRLCRVTSTGTLESFNPDSNGEIRDIVMLPDGKMIVGGLFGVINAATRNRLARINTDGTNDRTFAIEVNAEVRDLEMQADGKILMMGIFTLVGDSERNRLARITQDGILDNTFDPNPDFEVRGMVEGPYRTAISSIVPGSPVTINTAAPHGMTTGELVVLSGISGRFGAAINATHVVTVSSPTQFTVPVDCTSVMQVAGVAVSPVNPPGSPCTVTTTAAHGLTTNDVVILGGINGGTFSTPINGSHTVTVVSPTTFTVPVECIVAPAPASIAPPRASGRKITLGGIFSNVGGSTQQWVGRLNPNGAADPMINRVVDDLGRHTSMVSIGGNPAISYYDAVTKGMRYIRSSDVNGGGWTQSIIFKDFFGGLMAPADDIAVGTAMCVANIGGDLITKDTRGNALPADDEVTVTGVANNGTPVIAYNNLTQNRIEYIVALNATGTDWSNPVTLVAAANAVDMKLNPADSTTSYRSHMSLCLVDGFPALAYYDATARELKYVRSTNTSGITNNLRDTVTLDILKILVSDLVFTSAWPAPLASLDTGLVPSDTIHPDHDVGMFPSMAIINGRPTTAKGTPAITYYDRTDGNLKFVRALTANGVDLDPTNRRWDAPQILQAVDATGQLSDVGAVTTLMMTDGVPVVSFYDATHGDILFLGVNDATGYSRLAFDTTSSWSGDVDMAGTLTISAESGQTATLSGLLTGAAGFKLASQGTLLLTNASNNFGTSISGPGVTAAPGAAINGAALIRSGTLLVGAGTALGGATVELGDHRPKIITVSRATTFGSLALKKGRFDATHNGETTNSGGPGAFVEVDPNIDGQLYGVAEDGDLILVKDEVANPERNGVYRIVSDLADGVLPAGTINLVRVTDFDSVGRDRNLAYGVQVRVTEGSSAGKAFYLASLVQDLNISPVHWLEEQADANVSLLAGVSGITINNAVDINTVGGAGEAFLGGALTVTSGQLVFSGPITLQNLRPQGPGISAAQATELKTLNLTSSTSTGLGVIISGKISEADGNGTGPTGAGFDVLSLVKTGSGVLTLNTGDHTFHGGVTVNQGTLLVMNTSGSATGTGSVTVEAGAVLGGIGIMDSNVLLRGTSLNKAILRPGDPTSSAASVEMLTINKTLTMGVDSVVEFTIGVNNITQLFAGTIVPTPTSRIVVNFGAGFVPVLGQDYDLGQWILSELGGVDVGDTTTANGLRSILQLPVEYVWDIQQFTAGKIIAVSESQPPVITDDPDNLVVLQNASAVFTAQFTGTDPLSYQWYRNGQPVPGASGTLALGATSVTLTLTNVTQAQEGLYSVEIINPRGSDVSAQATLLVDWPVDIVTSPVSKSAGVGNPVTFTVTAVGEPAITYEWRKGVDVIPGVSGPTFTIPSVQVTDQGTYTVTAFNTTSTGPKSDVSAPFVLTPVFGDATIIEAPTSKTVLEGSSITLTANIGGDDNLRKLQWKRNNIVIPGATTDTLVLNNITVAQGGDYSIWVTNKVIATGKATKADTSKSPARILVVANPNTTVAAKVGAASTNLTVVYGAAATLKPVFVWKKNGGPLPVDGRFVGGTTKTLSVKKAVMTDSDVYSVEVTGAPDADPLTVTGGTQTLVIYDKVPLIGDVVFPDGIVGGTYDYTIPTNPDPTRIATKYSMTPPVPGLKIDAKTGRITGKPTAPKDYTVTVTVANDLPLPKPPTDQTRTVTLRVLPLPPGVEGTFAALMDRHPAAVFGTGVGGRFDLTVTKTATLTGSLTFGTTRTAVTGALNVTVAGEVSAALTVKRTGVLPPFLVNFTLANNLLTNGTVTDGTDTVAMTTDGGWRLTGVATSSTPAASFDAYLGYHTMGLALPDTSPLVGNAAVPQGSGFASFTVAKDGKYSYVGKTPDGDGITGAVFLGPNGRMMMYQYIALTKGSLHGLMNIDAKGDANTANNTLAGSVTLVRPPNTAKTARLYKGGYGTAASTSGVTTPVTLQVVGGRYTPPTGTVKILDLVVATPPVAPNAELEFSYGGVDVDLDNTAPPVNVFYDPNINVTVNDKGAIQVPAKSGTVNLAATRLSAIPTTGAFSGGFTLEDGSPVDPLKLIKRPVTFQGMVINEGGVLVGVGYFLLPQLPAPGSPPTTPTTSTIHSGMAVFKKKN